jgi:lipid-binding SYLF domain-containing protein
MIIQLVRPTNAIKKILLCIVQVGRLKSEKAIPDGILKQAKGLAIITVVKVGMMVTYKVGTGLVVARRADGSWSPPSAISTCGIGYGAQVISSLQVFYKSKKLCLYRL